MLGYIGMINIGYERPIGALEIYPSIGLFHKSKNNQLIGCF